MKYPVSRPSLGQAERELLLEAFDSGWITSGPKVKQFERDFAEFVGVPHAVATTSGTTALHLALAALGIGCGDEVIVPNLTYVATANAVAYCGARPVFVDIDATTYGVDAEHVADAITQRTRAIVPVHLYGHSVDVDALAEVVSHAYKTKGWRIRVVEDAAEGLGGSYRLAKLGALGDMGCFSFFGNKVMTTGEGGMVVAHDAALAQRLRHLRGMANHPTRRYFHTEVGFNYRMTDLQAAVGIAQLRQLPGWLDERRRIVDCYSRRMCHHGLAVPSGAEPSVSAPWLFTFELPAGTNREQVMESLAGKGIETRPTFAPMHEIFNVPEYGRGFPVSKRVAQQGMSLPTYPGLSLESVNEICDEVIACL